MDLQAQQELQARLAELQTVVNLYNPKEGLWLCVSFLSFQAICAVVITDLSSSWGIYGVLAGILLLALFIIPLAIYAAEYCTLKKRSPSNKELAERACALMNSCINLYRYPYDDPFCVSMRTTLTFNYNKSNLTLYKRFIATFPQMESKQLKKLSSIKLRG